MNPQNFENRKMLKAAFTATLMLLLSTGTFCTEPSLTLIVEDLNNAELPRCATHTNAIALNAALRASSVTTIQNANFITFYIKAVEGGQPSCVEVDESIASTSNFYSGTETWTFTSAQRDNDSRDVQFGQYDYFPAQNVRVNGSPLTDSMDPLLQNLSGLPRGRALVIIHNGYRVYKSYNYGGFWFCDKTCSDCSGPTRTDCTACQPWASVAGSTIHASINNGCYCPAGDANTAGTACDANACDSTCKNCVGPTANDCVQCATGFKAKTAGTFPTACERDSICHRTCETCSGPGSDKCLTCKDFSPNGKLTLQNGECRCPAGKFLLDNEDKCENCHSSCSSCTGPGADQCIICSNNQAIAIKAAGATAGTCFACADPANSGSAQCVGKVVTLQILSGSETGPSTIQSIGNQPFQIGRPLERNPKQVIPFSLGTNIINQIKALGDRFVFTDFMSISIAGLTSPTDYTFTGAVNEADTTYDVTFDFKGSPGEVTVVFTVIQSNYFLVNLPTATTRRRALQALSAANQQSLDSAQIVKAEPISVGLKGVYSYDQDKLDFVEEAGVSIKVFIYGSIFLTSILLVLTMLASKYDGRFLTRILDYCFFLSFIVKIPYIPADYNTYELIMWDNLVKADIVQMTEVITEDKVRARLQEKFLEYSIPAIINNNATYFASFFFIGLIFLLLLETLASKINMGKIGVVARTIAALFICWSLPSTFFYSSLSTLFYSLTETYGGFKKFIYYAMGFLTFVISLSFIVFLALTGLIWGYEGKNPPGDAGLTQGSQQNATSSNQAYRSRTKVHNTFQKLSIEGLNEQFLNPPARTSIPVPITLEHISMIRYALIMVLIVLSQKSKAALLSLALLLQLAMLAAAVVFGCVLRQLESGIIGGLYIAFEGAFLALLGGLSLIAAVDREIYTDKSYWRGTVPLVVLLLLTITLKVAHLLMASWLEYRRNRIRGGVEEPGNLAMFTAGNDNLGKGQNGRKIEGEAPGLRNSERASLKNGSKGGGMIN